jgi:hypothetical protein
VSASDRQLTLLKISCIPACEDRRWFGWTRSLLDFLKKKQQTWKSLNEWSRDRNIAVTITRHLLAWLEMSGEAEFDTASKKWYHTEKAGRKCLPKTTALH